MQSVIRFVVVKITISLHDDLKSTLNNQIGPMQIKNSTHLYARLFVRALSHQDLRMRLAAIIAISETAIDNLSFQMKVIPIDLK